MPRSKAPFFRRLTGATPGSQGDAAMFESRRTKGAPASGARARDWRDAAAPPFFSRAVASAKVSKGRASRWTNRTQSGRPARGPSRKEPKDAPLPANRSAADGFRRHTTRRRSRLPMAGPGCADRHWRSRCCCCRRNLLCLRRLPDAPVGVAKPGAGHRWRCCCVGTRAGAFDGPARACFDRRRRSSRRLSASAARNGSSRARPAPRAHGWHAPAQSEPPAAHEAGARLTEARAGGFTPPSAEPAAAPGRGECGPSAP